MGNKGINKIQEFKNISFLFENKKCYYKPKKLQEAFGDNYLKFKGNSDKYKKLSLAQALDE